MKERESNSVRRRYELRAALYARESRRLRRRSRVCVAGKLVAFLAFAYLIYLSCAMPVLYVFALTAVSFAAYIIFLLVDNNLVRRIKAADRRHQVCADELKALSGDFTPFRSGERFVNTEHEYTYDLDIFGRDSLFNRINRTATERGETTLARMLSRLCQSKEEIERNADAIGELSGKYDLQIDIQAAGFVPDSGVHHISGKAKRMPKAYIIMLYTSVAVTVLSLLCAVTGITSYTLFTVMFLVQLSASLLSSRTLTRYGLQAGGVLKEYEGYESVLKRMHAERFTTGKLKAIHTSLFTGERNSLRAFRQLAQILSGLNHRSNIILYIVLNGLFANDIMLIRRIRLWSETYSEAFDKWLDAVGEFDALLSLAVYAGNHPENTRAELVENTDTVFEATGMYHPFLTSERAVPNDFTLTKRVITIVTGANMAGKSTFLRTAGVNYVLACCGCPVCAREFRFSLVTLFTSMRTADNLSRNISYFNAELIRLERLIVHVKTRPFTLIILDEILKGTNSADKLNGSRRFLAEISRHNIAGIIATHDLELARMEESDAHTFVNYCFEIRPDAGETYSYKIERGIAKNMNASMLLEQIIRRLR